MRRLWLLWIVGCGSGSAPRQQPVRVATPVVVAAPAPVEPAAPVPAPPPAEPTPKTPCELDDSSTECRCSKDDLEACLRIATSEFRRGHHDIALSRILGLCQTGFVPACFAGARFMTQGKLATRHGSTPAQLKARGIQLYEERCAANDRDACLDYGRLLLAGKQVPVDLKRGRELVEKACVAKHLRGCVLLASLYATGEGVKKDRKRARELLEQACTADGSAGCATLGDQLAKTDRKRALELYERACAADDGDGCARSADEAKRSGDKERHAAHRLKACELEHTASCVEAGTLTTDATRARAAFERACDVQIAAGCVGLAPFVAEGRGGPRNWGAGVELAEAACKDKAPKACEVAKKLRATPPQVTCATVETCRPLCDEEKIPGGCRLLAERMVPEHGCDGAGHDLEMACAYGDAESCVLRGHTEQDSDDAAGFYDTACKAKHTIACTLRDRIRAVRGEAAERKRATLALQRACKARVLRACTLYAEVLVLDNPRESDRLLQASCDAGEARACRLLSRIIDGAIPPEGLIGVSGDSARRDPKIDQRVMALAERACKLGDPLGCARMQGKLDGAGVELRCMIDLAWAP